MRDDIIRIQAKAAREGMMLCYDNPRYDTYIDDVTTARDGWMHIRTGIDGTGSEYREPEDIIWIRYP